MTASLAAAALALPIPIPPPATRLSPIDLAIVALYLIAITLFGLRYSRKNKQQGSSLKSYFLADNTIPWWAIALSIVSAETSTLTIVSIPGVAFGGDFGFLQIVLGYMLGRIVVAALFLPRYFRGEMLTAYQLIDRRFGHTLHKVTAGLFLLTRAAAEGVRVFAISIVVGIAIGTGDTLSIFLISFLTLLYTFEGGMAAVIWTDVVQMALYVAGTLVALFTLGHSIPGGWSHIHAVAAPLGKFHMLNFAFNLTQSYTFWAGILGGTFLTMASHGTDQLMVQRMLAARNLRESRLALLSSGVVIFLQFTLFLLIGVGLFVFYGQAESSGAPLIAQSAMSGIKGLSADRIFPTFIVTQLPHGIAGLLIAAILAAAMSNLSAALNSLASTTVVDFYLPFQQRRRMGAPSSADGLIVGQGGVSSEARPSSSGRPQSNTTLISRLATIVWAIILFLIAVYSIQHGGKGHVVETGLSIASVAYGCLLGVFLLGTLTARSSKYGATQSGTIIGMLCGFALNLTLWLPTITPIRHLGPILIPKVAFTWYVLLGALVTFAIGSLASFILPKPRRTAAFLLCGIVLASRYPEALASGLTSPHEGEGLQPLGYALVSQPKASPASYDFSEVSSLMDAAIAQKKLPGAVVLIGHNNHIAFEKAYGNRALEPTLEPMTEDTLFDMASLTKVLVTTTAILQLYEQHKLDLDAPVAHYLPTFAAASRYPEASASGLSADKDEGGLQPLGYASQAATWKSQITIRQLLTHYSGLPEDVDLKDDWGLQKPDKPEGIRRALAAIPYGPPGLTFKYSDINFITLGYLVETLSAQPLDLYARDHIFAPLGMTSTAYHSFARTCGPIKKVGSAIEFASNVTANTNADGTMSVSIADYACPPPSWIPQGIIPQTAPTAHDTEGTPTTNPDFDHILHGTVHDPTTRRMGGVAGHAGVFSTAQDMSLFCQALLDKLLKNTGPFPLKQSTLRLATAPNEPATAVNTATIFTPDGQTTKGVASRGLGWDLNSPFSRPRGEIFPLTTRAADGTVHPGSFGHTGFTGTSLWLDPTSNTYVILLANAIHPRVAASISPLRGQVATATARALGLGATTTGAPSFSESHPGKGGVSSEARPPSSAPTKTARHPERLLRHAKEESKDPETARLTQAAWTTHPEIDPVLALASRYPEASASGLTSATKKGLQPLGYAPPSSERILLASRYPEASASAPTPAPKREGLQHLGYAPPSSERALLASRYPEASASGLTTAPKGGLQPLGYAPPSSERALLASRYPEASASGLTTAPKGGLQPLGYAPPPSERTLLASRYPEASASGLTPATKRGLQPLGYAPPSSERTLLASRYPEASASGLTPATKKGLQPLGYAPPSSERALLASSYPEASASGLTPATTKGLQPLRYAPPSSERILLASRYPEASASGLTTAPKEGLQPLGYSLPPSASILTGIDVLEQTQFAPLKSLAAKHQNHLHLALLTNQSGIDTHGRRTIDILAHASPEITLLKIFSPEHGLYGKQDTEHLATETDPTTHLPVISLYGPKPSDKHPKPADLKNVDAIVIDLQDAGVRFWTYETLLGYFLEAAAESHTAIIVLDRPNPIAAVTPQGPTSDPTPDSTYTNFLPIPLRHSLTFGELARYFNANLPPASGGASTTPAPLTVIPMRNYSRTDYYEDTGLPWTPPSPNLKTPRAAILYPALGLTEQTNISVGRGTPTPFENLGSPWINPQELAAFLTAREIPGITITPTTMTIAEDANHYPFHGQTIPAIHFQITDLTALDSPELGLELLSALHHLYPTQFQLERCKTLLANASTLEALTQMDAQDPRDIASTWTPALDRFRQATAPYLLYP